MLEMLALLWLTDPAILPESDRFPAGQVAHPGGRYTIEVAEGGLLTIRDIEGRILLRHGDVLSEFAVAPDGSALVVPERTTGETNLLWIELPSQAVERLHATPLTVWSGFEDRPSFSPDGRWLAFVAGSDGWPCLFLTPAPAGSRATLPLAPARVEQLTNRAGRDAGVDGFVPPPAAGGLRWTEEGVYWSVEGRSWWAPLPVAPTDSAGSAERRGR